MLNYLFVFIGGGLGSMCRYGIAHWLIAYKFNFPWATLAANALSCIILGILMGIQLKQGVSTSHKFLIMTGFCGGFSTFSTFSSETVLLFQAGQLTYALGNVLFNLMLCWICIYLGIKIIGN